MDRQTWEALQEVTNAFKVSRNLSVWGKQRLEVESFHTSYEAAQKKFLFQDIQDLIQRLLNEHPTKATEIHDLSTIIFKILRH